MSAEPPWPDLFSTHVPRNALTVLFEDDAIAVVHKPAGLAVQGADDDVLSRMPVRAGAPPWRVPVLLARDVSGVLVLARGREAHDALASQHARGAFVTRWSAVVPSWPRQLKSKGELRTSFVSRQGKQTVTQPAVLRYATEGMRVTIDPVSGPLHHVREQLARENAPVRGDIRNHGTAAYRVMLAQTHVRFEHPVTGARCAFEVREPEIFRHGDAPWWRWDDVPALARHIADAALSRAHVLARSDTEVCRLANDEGDGLAAVTVDRYGPYALVQCYDDAARQGLESLARALVLLGAKGVHVKYRPKQSNTLVDTRRDALAPRTPLAGESAPDEFTVREGGLAYRVRLTDGLSTGIFLDQRENRAWVRAQSEHASVLNLFAYTCAFSVSAAAGGASRVVSVDASAGALVWGRANAECNALDPAKHAFVTADVFGWIEGARARGDRFDLIVLDPPSYSTTHDGPRFSAASDYESLLALVLSVLAPKGKLLACSNHRKISVRRFRAMCERAAHTAFGARARVHMRHDPVDFPAMPGLDSHLKQAVVERT